jgi:hypothetical protein
VIVVWSDYVSPYAFVAKAGAYALEADYEVELQCPTRSTSPPSWARWKSAIPIIGAACAIPTWTPGGIGRALNENQGRKINL